MPFDPARPSAIAVFFFSPWIVMVFWGIVAEDVGIAIIALWLAWASLIAFMAKGFHED